MKEQENAPLWRDGEIYRASGVGAETTRGHLSKALTTTSVATFAQFPHQFSYEPALAFPGRYSGIVFQFFFINSKIILFMNFYE